MERQQQEAMLVTSLENLFDDTLLNQSYNKIMEGKVQEGMNDLLNGLHTQRLNSSDQEWAEYVSLCQHHPLRELLHQDPFTARAFKKPRGYAGDAELLDMIYGREERWPVPPETSELGRKIFEYTTLTPACEGVRARREFIANLLDRLVEEVNRPLVLSVAAGHLREAILSSAVKRKKFGKFIALDSDTQSLEVVDREYGSYGVEVVAATVRQLLTGRLSLGCFDLIYSTGLFDYVQQLAAQRLTSAMFQMLNPRGRLLLANFFPDIGGIGYMESYMQWKLIYRTRQEMLIMTDNIPQQDIRDIRIFTEENQNIIFLQVTKR